MFCFFNCCEPLIINKKINIHKKMHVNIHVEDVLMLTSFVGSKWVYFTDFTLVLFTHVLIFFSRSKFAKNLIYRLFYAKSSSVRKR